MKSKQDLQSFKLSRYVFKDEKYNVLHNSMTQRNLPIDSPKEILEKELFLNGQEKDSLNLRLFKPPRNLQLNISPTWECTLRCKHCSILYKLKKQDECKINKTNLINFINSYCELYKTENISLSYISGEAMIENKFCLDTFKEIKKNHKEKINSLSTTTNLAYDLNKTIIDFFNEATSINVSLDGLEDQHNWQRKSFNKINVYNKVIANIKRLILLGLKDKITIQASIQDEVYSEEKKRKFYKMIYSLGINNILYGCVHPTKQNPELDQSFKMAFKSKKIKNIPCCNYRYMSYFNISSNNKIYRSYYTEDDNTFLGDLENFNEINLSYLEKDVARSYKEGIKKDMAIFQDDQCLNHCPVLAYCWGKCVSHDIASKKKPSNFCNQKLLFEESLKLHKEGKIIDRFKGTIQKY